MKANGAFLTMYCLEVQLPVPSLFARQESFCSPAFWQLNPLQYGLVEPNRESEHEDIMGGVHRLCYFRIVLGCLCLDIPRWM